MTNNQLLQHFSTRDSYVPRGMNAFLGLGNLLNKAHEVKGNPDFYKVAPKPPINSTSNVQSPASPEAPAPGTQSSTTMYIYIGGAILVLGVILMLVLRKKKKK